jgi:hypothetical protein
MRVRHLTGLRPDVAPRLVAGLVTLPATATTVALTATSATEAEMVVRVAAPDVTTGHTLRRLLGTAGADLIRLDGEQLAGLAGTLPLGLAGAPGPAGPLATARTELPPAGVMLGHNRRGVPVTARLLRPEPTRAVLVGGVPAAQILTLRTLALGALVLVRTARPDAWTPFLRAISAPGDAITLVPPGQPVDLLPAEPAAPQFVVVDAGPAIPDAVPGEAAMDAAEWRTTLVVRDDLAPADLDTLARADLVILQPLRPEEAELAGTTLGLGDNQQWLTRIRADMIGIVNRRTVRFALLSATALEQQFVGAPERLALA